MLCHLCFTYIYGKGVGESCASPRWEKARKYCLGYRILPSTVVVPTGNHGLHLVHLWAKLVILRVKCHGVKHSSPPSLHP